MAKAPRKKDVKPRAAGGARRSRATAKRRATHEGAGRKPINHNVMFRVCGARVVVDPGIVQVFSEDTVTFGNDTGGEVKLYLATGGVLKGVRPMAALSIREKSGGKGYQVIGKPGVYECAAHYKLKDKKGNEHTGFAVGASSPKIIILPPSRN